MFNLTLFKKELRSNYKVILVFLALITLYSSVIVIMFDPELGKSLDMMAQTMPELFAAFGMMEVGSTLIEFIANYLYGFILIAIPLVCVVILANRLVARYVDNGSMSYLLASPHSRMNIITTQAITLALSILFLVVFATGVIYGMSALSFPGELDVSKLIMLNVGLLAVLLFIGSICFLGSCVFNDTKKSSGLGGGVIILSILLQMLSQVGDKFEFLKYMTPLTLFDVTGIMAGSSQAYFNIGILFIGTCLMNAFAIMYFCKKDLSI